MSYTPELSNRGSIAGWAGNISGAAALGWIALTIVIAAAFIIGISGAAFADINTTAGKVSAYSDNSSGADALVVSAPYTGDSDNNNSITVQWKLCPDVSYASQNTITSDTHPASPFIATISTFYNGSTTNPLAADTCYTIKVTYTDGNVMGVNPQEFKINTTWDNTLLHNVNRFSASTKWTTLGGWGLAGAKYGQIVCETCHAKATSNIKRIKGAISAPSGQFPGQADNATIVFDRTSWNTVGAGTFGDDTGGHSTSTKICEYCHSTTNFHRYNTAGQSNLTHSNNAECTGCHPHSAGFYYVTGACDSCHGWPAGPTTTDIGGPSGLARPATEALGASPSGPGAHAAHVTGRSITCDACHTGTNMPSVSNTIDMGFVVNAANFPGWGSSAVTTGTFVGSNTLTNGYSWAASNAGTSVSTGSNGNVSCTLYCHGSTLTGGSNATTPPTWTGGSSAAACGTCHGGSAFDDPADTPPTTGSHPFHAGSAEPSPGIGCKECHSTTPQNMTHVNGKVSWGLDTSWPLIGIGATYRGAASGTMQNLAPSSPYGQCSNVYCHSDVQGSDGTGDPTYYSSPQWGNASDGACGTCHKGDGVAGNQSLMDSGSHTKHVGPTGSGNYNNFGNTCADTCHYGAGLGTSQHTNYIINVAINAQYGGEYGGDSANGHNNSPGYGYGNCSSVYCHSSGNRNSGDRTYAAPAWGSAATGACGTCHGATASAPPQTGSHVKHAGDANPYQFKCYECHSITVNSDGSGSTPATISSGGYSTYHVNGTIDVSFDSSDPLIGAAGAWFSSGGSTCSTIYCHSMGKADIVNWSSLPSAYNGSPYAVPQWGASLGCDSCHGRTQQASVQRPYAGYPDYPSDTNTEKGTAKANSHLATAHNKTSCSVCHNQTTTDGTTIRADISPAKHVNNEINVAFDSSYVISGRTATYNADSGKPRTCQNVACHGVESGQWGALGSCVDCHEAGAINISGAHSRHWETTAGNATARATGNSSTASYYKFQCLTCHPDGTHPRGVIGEDFADVGDWNSFGGTFNVAWLAGDKASLRTSGHYTLGTWDTVDSRLERISVNGSCSNIYCHSTGLAPGAPWPTFRTITWNATPGSPNDCAVCHDAPPVTNRHDVHASTYGYRCVECHSATVSDNDLAAMTIIDKSKHVNGTNDVSWKSGGRNAGGDAYNADNYSCANIYCHSKGLVDAAPYWTTANTPNNNTLVWTSATTSECTGCHSGNATASGGLVMSSGKHTYHINNAGLIGVNVTCDRCHSSTASADRAISGTANHVNKQIDVAFKSWNSSGSYSPNGHAPGESSGSCSNLYCHSSGNLSAPSPYRTQTWSEAEWSSVCNKCHGTSTTNGAPDYASGTAGSATANSHSKHSVTYNISCSVCHNTVTASGTAIDGSSPSLHINKIADVGFAGTYGSSNIALVGSGGGYTTVTKTCANVYCHSNVQAPGGGSLWSTFFTPQWGANNSLTCGSCHKDMSTLQEPTGPSDPDMQYGSHKRHTVDGSYSCALCHGTGYSYTTVSAATHANGVIDISFTGDGTGSIYSQAGSNPPGNGYGNCTNTLCHGRGQRFWGVNTSLNICEKCHGSARTANGGSCSDSSYLNQADCTSHSGAWTPTSGYCSDGRYATSSDCTTNNGIWTTIGAQSFKDTSLSPSSLYAGTHVSHLSGPHNMSRPITCSECHIVPPTADINGVHSPNHWGGADYTSASWSGLPARINWGTLAITGRIIGANNLAAMTPSFDYNGSDKTCSNTYCHSGVRLTDDSGSDLGPQVETPPFWGQNGFLGGSGCNKCHGYPPPYPHPLGSNCNGCHPHVAVTNTGFMDDVIWPEGSGIHVVGKTLHIDGKVEFSVDACLDCHNTTGIRALIGSHSLHTDADYFLSKSPTWSTWPLSWSTGTATSGAANALTDNSQTWMTNSLAGYYVRIKSGANMDKQLKITGNTPTTVWSSSATPWTTVVVSGDLYEIRQARTLTAGDYDDVTWHFDIYYESGFPKFACGNCHDLTVLSNRNNGIVDLDLDPAHASAGTVKTKNLQANLWNSVGESPWINSRTTGQSITCQNVYCHSSGYVSEITNNYNYRVTPDWYWSEQHQEEPFVAGGADRCSWCHGNSPNTGTGGDYREGSAAHAKHVVSVHYTDIYSGTSGKMAQGWTTSADGVHGNAATSTTINCNICHNSTVKVSYNDKNAVCAACHGGNAKGTMMIDPNGTTHINGTVEVEFSSALWSTAGFKVKAQLRDNITDVPEITGNWTRNNGYKASTSYDSSKPTPSYNAGSCLNTACHNGTPMEWGQAGPLRCAACHKGLPR